MVDNRPGIKVTFSVPEKDVKEVREIINFCKEHNIPYSPILIKRFKEWYKEHKANIQKMFYHSDKLAG